MVWVTILFFEFSDQFVYFREDSTWNNSRTKCIELGGDLASIGSKTDLELFKKMLATAQPNWWIWVGYNDKESEGDFVWSDGTQTSELGWHVKEPNGGSSENCVFVNAGTITIFDAGCNLAMYYACKLK